MRRRYDLRTVRIHGHERAYVLAGQGPALLLVHGLGNDHHSWDPVLPRLARHFTVIAPDLLGHGRSDKPRGDYSIGGYANGMRDLLTVLGIDTVTVVGHSLGGGVAMQFAYQFPERTERLMLLSPGGLGPEVIPLLRAVTLPFAGVWLDALTLPPVRLPGVLMMRALRHCPLTYSRDLGELADMYQHLADPATRAAFRQVVSSIIDWRGQIVTMADRAYLTERMPLCIVWGADDFVIPVRHADTAARIAPRARIEVLADCGHFPHRDHPRRVVSILRAFVRDNPAAEYDRDHWRGLLSRGPDGTGPGTADVTRLGA